MGSLGSLLGGQEACARVVLVLSECIWSAPAVSVVLPAFDVTGSWFHRFLVGNRGAELNLPLSLYSYFSVFSYFSSSPEATAIQYL